MQSSHVNSLKSDLGDGPRRVEIKRAGDGMNGGAMLATLDVTFRPVSSSCTALTSGGRRWMLSIHFRLNLGRSEEGQFKIGHPAGKAKRAR